jgi:hypothetical protein
VDILYVQDPTTELSAAQTAGLFQLVVPADGSMLAGLRTGPDFGCSHHEQEAENVD